MSEAALAGWALLMVAGFAGSAFYSGTETGAYSLNRIRLHILERRGDARARRLHRLLADPTILLSTLLIGNNLMNYVGTASLAVILQGRGLSTWENIVLNTLIVTPTLFLFSETLPKDLFAAYCDKLMYPLSRLLTFSRWAFTAVGLVPTVSFFSRFVMRTLGHGGRVNPFHPRRQVKVLVKEGVGYGLLSDEQSALVERVLDLAHRTVGDEMVPWDQVMTVGAEDSPTTLWVLADQTSRSRFPVLDAQGKVVGVLDIADALLHDKQSCPPIRSLIKPMGTLAQTMAVRQGLAEMRRRHLGLAAVVDPQGREVGVVTMKDLVEAVTGELASW